MLFAALGINYARQGVARQSSRYANAQKAIDGKTGGPSEHANCIRTNPAISPWWTVFFMKVILVRMVIIQNGFDWRGK